MAPSRANTLSGRADDFLPPSPARQISTAPTRQGANAAGDHRSRGLSRAHRSASTTRQGLIGARRRASGEWQPRTEAKLSRQACGAPRDHGAVGMHHIVHGARRHAGQVPATQVVLGLRVHPRVLLGAFDAAPHEQARRARGDDALAQHRPAHRGGVCRAAAHLRRGAAKEGCANGQRRKRSSAGRVRRSRA